jgi:hypothetical protein
VGKMLPNYCTLSFEIRAYFKLKLSAKKGSLSLSLKIKKDSVYKGKGKWRAGFIHGIELA